MPDELWMEVRDTVQETGIKTIPKKNKCTKAKRLSEEALQIAVKREEKSKGEKESYKHLDAEFQRIARRDKKAFLSGQCNEIEENNRMGKTRDLFKKTADIKRTFHAKIDTIKDKKSKIVVRGGLTDSCEKKSSEKQRRKGEIYPFEHRVPKNSKER